VSRIVSQRCDWCGFTAEVSTSPGGKERPSLGFTYHGDGQDLCGVCAKERCVAVDEAVARLKADIQRALERP
jgi:hypothetical protein